MIAFVWSMKLKILIVALVGAFTPFFSLAALIITQVQTTGGAGKTTWDAIQIYNPDKTPVDLKGYRLVKRTKVGTTDNTALKSFASSIVIPQCGYFLWANSDAILSVEADSKMSGTISDDNGLALRNGGDDVGEIIDNVAWGAATNVYSLAGGNPANPVAGQTVQRSKSGANYSGIWEVKTAAEWYNLQTPPGCESEAVVVVPAPSGGLSGGGAGGDVGASVDMPAKTAPKINLRINEIVPNPRAEDRGNEFIELFNDGDKEIDLKNWQLKIGEQIQIFIDLKIPAKSFWVLKYPALKISLSNTGKNTVQILNADEENIFKTIYDAGDENLSWSYNGKKWHWSTELTPNTENKIVSPPAAVKAVIDAPSSADWGEIVMFDGSDSWGETETENLEYKWTFDDGTTADTRQVAHLYLKPGKYHVVLEVLRKLDKKSDQAKKTVEIMASIPTENKMASAIISDKAEKATSVSETTALKMPAAKSSIKTASFIITDVRPLAEVKTWKIGSYLSTEAVVAVKNNILGKGVFYVAGSGLRVAAPTYTDELAPGQKIKIYGQLKETQGEKYIAVKNQSQIQVVETVEPPLAKEVVLADVKDELIGELIKISGRAGRVSGRYFYVEDGNNSLRVYQDDGAFPQVAKIIGGAEVAVTGFLSKTNSGLRLLPRNVTDIVINNPPAPETEKSVASVKTPWWVWALIILAGAVGLEASREKSFIARIFKKK